MNKYTFLTALLALVLHTHGNCQGFNAPVKYNNGVPTAPPSNNGSRIYVDMLTGFRYNWNQSTSAWQKDADGVLQIAGASAPLAAPGYGQPRLAMNNPAPPARPDLYVWIGPGNTDWGCLTCVESANVNAGTGIAVTGTPPNITVTNTAPNVVQTLSQAATTVTLSGGGGTVNVDPSTTNELQTISLSGQNLTLSNGGGTVEIPAGADGNGIYGGSGDVPDSAVATLNGLFHFGITSPVAHTFGRTNVDGISGFTGHVIDNNNFSGLGFDTRNGSPFFRHTLASSDGSYATLISQNGVSMSFTSIDVANSASAQFSAGSGLFAMSAIDGIGNEVSFGISPTSAAFLDNRPVKLGIEYPADYSADLVNNPGSLTDVQTVQRLTGSATTVTGATSALANAAAATAGVPVGGPYRWDDGSSIHLMFRR